MYFEAIYISGNISRERTKKQTNVSVAHCVSDDAIYVVNTELVVTYQEQ
jgi:hypothetical protein